MELGLVIYETGGPQNLFIKLETDDRLFSDLKSEDTKEKTENHFIVKIVVYLKGNLHQYFYYHFSF